MFTKSRWGKSFIFNGIGLRRKWLKPERGYEARHSYATQRFEPTRSPSKLGRFCQPCAVEVAHEKNLEHNPARQGRHGKVRHLVKEGKEV